MDDATDILARPPALSGRSSFLSTLGLVALAGAVLALSAAAAWGLRQRMERRAAPGDGAGPAAVEPGDRERARLRSGGLVYRVHCLRCHGVEGHGDGPDSANLSSAPRDFASPSGWRRDWTPGAIRRATAEGIPGTPMLAWGGSLSAPELDSVVAYVRSLAPPPRDGRRPGPSPARLVEAGFQPIEPAVAAPPLAIEDLSGSEHTLDEFRGRPTLLVFWGTTCAPCLEELPSLERLHEALGGRGLAVVSVCVDEADGPTLREVVAGKVARLPLYLDRRGDARLRYDVQALPTVVLIDPEGRQAARCQGAREWSSPASLELLEEWLPR